MKSKKKALRQRKIKVRSPKLVKLRVGEEAGRVLDEEIVSVVGIEIAAESGKVEIVVVTVVVIERGEGAEAKKEEVVAEVGEAEVVTETGVGVRGIEDVVGAEIEAEIEVDEAEVEGRGEAGVGTETGIAEGAEAAVVTEKDVAAVGIVVAAGVVRVLKAACRATGTVLTPKYLKGGERTLKRKVTTV